MTVVPTFVGRVCRRDINDLEGYDIPKGTLIIANIWRVYHDSKIWGDSWNFRPERFLDADGQPLSRDNILRKSWMPSSVGRRQCLGVKIYPVYGIPVLEMEISWFPRGIWTSRCKPFEKL
ncbi:cytochrome P450 1A2-like [Mercenaria mercenaria]|uniref:cytochrome P450 1A2-like n=1 Tax=Mercenaria mercenaria TaxID=6596 RepID=UPI00234EF4DF|nr:cytochrome P450 1A2-like [Mercenaria mercenaria]